MKFKNAAIWVTIFFASASIAKADIMAITIDPSSLPFDLGPDRFANSPDKFDNSSDKFDNSIDKFANSPDKFDNSPDKFSNGISGDRRIISEDQYFLGYYVFSNSGVMNLYSAKGNRVAFMPSGGHTQSLFFSQGGWCGTLGESRGETVLGLTHNCYLRFKLD